MTKFLIGQQEKQTPHFYPSHLKFSWSQTQSSNSIIFVSHFLRFKSLACSVLGFFCLVFLSKTSCCHDRHFPAKAKGVLPRKRQVSPLTCCYPLRCRLQGEPCREDLRSVGRGAVAEDPLHSSAPPGSFIPLRKNPSLPEHNSVLITLQNPELYSTGVWGIWLLPY